MSKSRWDYEQTMKFVNLYEAEPVLWDTMNNNYTSKVARNVALERIVKGLNRADFDVKDCRLKIKNLRSHYWQEINKIQASQANGEVYKPTVAWFSALDRFLWRYTSLTNPDLETKSAKETPPITYVNVREKVNDEDTCEGDELTDDLTAEIKTEEKEESSVPNYGEKRARISVPFKPVHEALKRLERIHSEVKNANKETEFDIWAKSVAKQLNNMTLRRALEIQLKMQAVLTNERISELDDPIIE